MKFTDEYLKIEKEDLDNHIGGLIHMPEWKFRGLLARLEAAENAREHHAPLCTCDWCITWRKAAGK